MADLTWQDELRSRGYRVTPQRRSVLEAVGELEHATPDAIRARVQQTSEGLNLSTVYRTLAVPEEVGLGAPTRLDPAAPSALRAEGADHLHLVCRSCGEASGVPLELAEGLVAQLEERFGFRAH